MSYPTVVIGVLNDIHMIGPTLIGHALTKAGFNVVRVGALSTQEDMIRAAIETNAKAILVSSSYGHAIMDCEGMRQKCVEAGLKDVLLYVGGNLVVTRQNQDWADVEKTFKAMGYDRVYSPETTPKQAVADLKTDFGIKD
ncbi:MAG: methylaspartate mutase subunit S [Chloroflexi bacterium]|nr:methylaspartate mutase subunit S [Chloroflexota bacterium]